MANQYAKETTNTSSAPFEPVSSTKNALHTLEQAAMGFDPSTGRTPVEQANNYFYINTLNTFVIKAAPGFLHCITINKPIVGGVVTIYDNTSASNVIAAITMSSTQPFMMHYDILMNTGITIATTTQITDLTVAFR